MEYSFTNVWGRSWEVYGRAWGVLLAGVGAYIVVNIPSTAASMVQSFVEQSRQLDPNSVGPGMVKFGGACGIFSWVYTVCIVYPSMAGIMWMSLRAVRGQPAGVGDMLQGFRRFPSVIGAYFLTTLSMLVPVVLMAGGVLAIVHFAGGIDDFRDGVQKDDFARYSSVHIAAVSLVVVVGYVAMMWIVLRQILTMFLVIDTAAGPLGAVAAIRRSWELTRGRALPLFGLLIVMGLMLVGTALACCLPMLFLGIPLALIQFSVAYELLNKSSGSPVAQAIPEG